MPTTQLRFAALVARREDSSMSITRTNLCPSTWAVVLAAGDGARLSTLTRDSTGVPVPKQFCTLNGGVTLLQQTLSRTGAAARREHTAAIVAQQHERWWQHMDERTIVQPMNRGTANGILLAALTIARLDPAARLVFLPSDHYVEDETRLAAALKAASTKRIARGTLLLLGLEPSGPDPELGYIVPSAPLGSLHSRPVSRMVEKPPVSLASTLLKEGALWNSFIFAAEVPAIADLVRVRYPQVVADFESALDGGPQRLIELYERLPVLDFSRHILQGAEPRLSVLRVPDCGWSDLGTPRSVAACLGRLAEDSWHSNVARNAGLVSLAAAISPETQLRIA
jgi:mannose-1-phosphate guanylyltransferase